ncbi:MAG: hypothetical protein ABIH49_00055 [archaeon]
MGKKRLLIILLVFLFVFQFVSGATINVPGDYVTIQEAIDAASAGDVINVGAGMYVEDLTIITDNLEIVGEDKTITIIKGIANVPIASYPLAIPNIDIQANNVKINGFNVQSPDYVSGYYSSGIVLDGQNIEIYDNNLVTTQADTVGELAHAITTYSTTAIPSADSSGLDIHNNSITCSGSYGCEAIYLNPHTGTGTITINNNQFSGSVYTGVTSEADATITNNNIISSISGLYGVRFMDTSYTANLNDIVVAGNVIENYQYGLRIGNGGAGSSVFGALINSNTLINNGVGIWGRNGNQITATNNIISGNTFGIQNDDATTIINASYNYWGTIDETGVQSLIYGDVLYSPWMNTPFNVTPSALNVLVEKNPDNYTNNTIVNVTLTNGTYMPDLFALSLDNNIWSNWVEWGHNETINYTIDLTNVSLGGNSNDENKTVYVKVKNFAEKENLIPSFDWVVLDTVVFLDTEDISGTYFNGTNYIFSPENQDGVFDNVSIDLEYSESVDYVIYVEDLFGNFVRILPSGTGTAQNPQPKYWDGTNDSVNFVSDGFYLIKTNITDLAGNNNDNIIVTTVFVDNTKPDFVSFDSLPLVVSSSDDVQLNVTVNDATGINNVILELNGTNFTATNISNEFYFTILSGNYSSGDSVTYYWYAEDAVGNLNISSQQSFVVENAAPVINSFDPSGNNPIVGTNQTQDFSINASDSDGDTLNYSWFVDDVLQNSTTNSFSYSSLNEGNLEILVNVTDTVGSYASRTWTLTVTNIPIASNFTSPETTNLSAVNISAVENFTLANTNGKVKFANDILDLSNVLDLNNNVRIANGIVAINTSRYSELNKSAEITLSGLNYGTIPKIYFSDEFTTNPNDITTLCDLCNVTNYTSAPTNNGIITFTVPHFSSFKVLGSGEVYDLDLFDDLSVCKNGEVGDLTLTIENPDEGDDFTFGDVIEVDVEVENNGGEKKNVYVKSVLYDIDEDKEEESERSDDDNIKVGDSESFETEIKVPNDFDEDDDYLLFVKAYERGNENGECTQSVVGIVLEREKENVMIKRVFASPERVYPGSVVNVIFEIENVGSGDVDVSMSLRSNDLGISQTSDEFEIEGAGGDDFVVTSFEFSIPRNTVPGDYELDARILFNGEIDEKTIDVSVLENKFLVETIKTNGVDTKNADGVYEQSEEDFLYTQGAVFLFINLVLILGIFILIVLIFRFRKGY